MKICPQCNHHFEQLDWNCPACDYTPPSLEGHKTFASQLAAASEGFEAQFFSQLAKLEARNFWFRSRNRLIIYAIKRYFPQAQSFLEIGCGTGFVLQGVEKHFPHLICSGSEIFTEGLKFATERLDKTTLFQMDARQIPFVEEFDIIGAFDVLEHIEQDSDVLKQMYQATRMKGGIILTVPQHTWLWSQSDTHAHHVRRYAKEDIVIKLHQTGFKVVRITSFVSFLLPLMLISRLNNRSNSKKYDPINELKISGILNYWLEKILDMERWFIKLGASFPLGGSLLVIAYKEQSNE
jgi:SAM-dependent methyltransferase